MSCTKKRPVRCVRSVESTITVGRGRGLTSIGECRQMAGSECRTNRCPARSIISSTLNLLPAGRPLKRTRVFRNRPRLARITRVRRGLIGMLQIHDGLDVVLASPRVHQGDRSAGRGIVFGKRADDEVRIGHRAGVQNRLGKHHVVGVEGRFLRAVRIHRPQRLDRERVLVDVLPASKQNPAVGQRAWVELIDIVDRNRDGCRNHRHSSHA